MSLNAEIATPAEVIAEASWASGQGYQDYSAD